jgi:hypothetical protein
MTNTEKNTAARGNILVGIFFCIMIAGMAGSVHFYRKSRINEVALAKSKDSLKTVNASLDSARQLVEQERNRTQSALDKIDSLVKDLAHTHSATSLQPVLNVVQAADYERQGYEALQQKNFDAAKAAFRQSEEAYNGYHNSYEIYNLLNKNADSLKTDAGQHKVLQTIQAKYNWKAPVKLKEIVNDNSKNQ